jgi:O-6-methylguanine DNA methyltransferase
VVEVRLVSFQFLIRVMQKQSVKPAELFQRVMSKRKLKNQRSYIVMSNQINVVFLTSEDFGDFLLGELDQKICFLQFGLKQDLIEEISKRFPNYVINDCDRIGDCGINIDKVINIINRDDRMTYKIHLQGTPFQQSVWLALSEIHHGDTRSYADIAKFIGKPQAHRAVANACGANPVAILVPCHRVVGSNGSLGGYRWGLDMKKKLLKREGAL